MTKSDFVDKVATQSGLSKKDAGTAVDAVLSTIERRAQGRRRGLVHGLRQVPRREPRRPRGSQPAHWRDDDHRRQQGPALHRRLRPQEGRQVAGRIETREGAGAPAPSRVRPSPACGFGARLAAAVAERESQIVVGVDPDPAKLWPVERRLRRACAERPRRRRAGCRPAPRRPARPHAPASRPPPRSSPTRSRCSTPPPPRASRPSPSSPSSSGSGSPAGSRWSASAPMPATCGLLVLADAKRGDVPSTAAAYADALTGAGGLAADAITANPLLGRDALAPLVDGARAAGAGVFVLVRTSNPGAADVLDLELAGGEPLWERLAAMVDELGEGRAGRRRRRDRRDGARAPRAHARADAAHAVPAPGHRRPGRRRRDPRAGLRPGRAGGLVTASRSIANAHEKAGGGPARRRRAPRPSACAKRRGHWPEAA